MTTQQSHGREGAENQAPFQPANLPFSGSLDSYIDPGEQRDAALDGDSPLASVVTQLPGMRWIYHALEGWREEFAPRDYGLSANDPLSDAAAPQRIP